MAITVHIPNDLLRAVDARAQQQHISRSRFIVAALRQALAAPSEFSRDLAGTLAEPWPDAEIIGDVLHSIRRTRRPKREPNT